MYYFEWKHYYIQPLFHYYWNTKFVYILIFLDILVQLTIVLAGKVTDSGEKVTCQHYFKILFLNFYLVSGWHFMDRILPGSC